MSLDQVQQFEKVLENAKNVLILLPQNLNGDVIGSAWALYFFLGKKNIKATIVMSEKEFTQRYSFLPLPENIIEDTAGSRDFVLSFNTEFNKIRDVKTEEKEKELRIYITPEKGSIDPRDFSFIPAKFKYDLLICLSSPDKESIGKIYEDNPDIFYEVPVVNIDNHSENDHFGQINILDMTASSSSEILAGIFEEIGGDMVDEDMARCLLTGIIDSTNSFQKKNTTPKSMQVAASLMSMGADQQEIIRYLYKTQPLSLLKLWGRIMARLRWEEKLKIAWAPVLLEDFIQSRSNPADIPLILEKVRENYSNGKIFMVSFNEKQDKIKVVAKFNDSALLKVFREKFNGSLKGDTLELLEESDDPVIAGEDFIEKIRETIA